MTQIIGNGHFILCPLDIRIWYNFYILCVAFFILTGQQRQLVCCSKLACSTGRSVICIGCNLRKQDIGQIHIGRHTAAGSRIFPLYDGSVRRHVRLPAVQPPFFNFFARTHKTLSSSRTGTGIAIAIPSGFGLLRR